MKVKAEQQRIPLDDIVVDDGLQVRANGLSQEVVEDYAEYMEAGDVFPAITVFQAGRKYILVWGFHRLAGRKLARSRNPDDEQFATIAAEIHKGSRREAMLYAAGANSKQGLHRTRADKRMAVTLLLRDSEWAGWSDNKIAEACRVDHKTVAAVRASLGNSQVTEGAATRNYANKHGATAVMNTAKIGKGKQTEPHQNGAAAPPQEPATPAPMGDIAAPTPPACQVVDKKGRPVPESLQGAFEDAAAIRALVQHLGKAKGEIDKIGERPGGVLLRGLAQHFQAALTKLQGDLSSKSPHVVCPACGGQPKDKTCTCRGIGWVEKGRWYGLDSNLKKVCESYANGQPLPDTEPEMIPTDKQGQPVPEFLGEPFRVEPLFRALQHQLNIFVADAKELSELPGGEILKTKLKPLENAVKDARQNVAGAEPHSPCPDCGGRGCEGDKSMCRGRGWIAADVYERNKNDIESKRRQSA